MAQVMTDRLPQVGASLCRYPREQSFAPILS
ncbi:hypothetical protein PCAR4_180050 [Paraburkholderia caribensis]|nr:hypothetical protein PCAR4_180050 [Paraburkholderia caribensis]